MLNGVWIIIINLKLRVEMGGERGTRTMVRVLMNEDEKGSGSEGWPRTQGAGWEDLERIEAGIMFPQEKQAGLRKRFVFCVMEGNCWIVMSKFS